LNGVSSYPARTKANILIVNPEITNNVIILLSEKFLQIDRYASNSQKNINAGPRLPNSNGQKQQIANVTIINRCRRLAENTTPKTAGITLYSNNDELEELILYSLEGGQAFKTPNSEIDIAAINSGPEILLYCNFGTDFVLIFFRSA